jgi:hypothetical protein
VFIQSSGSSTVVAFKGLLLAHAMLSKPTGRARKSREAQASRWVHHRVGAKYFPFPSTCDPEFRQTTLTGAGKAHFTIYHIFMV